ncbi:MAG TPA: hypothetical protein VGD87_00110 [Archangium sp.]
MTGFLDYVFFGLSSIAVTGAVICVHQGDPIDDTTEAVLFALFAAVVGAYLNKWVGW